jgi:predicted dehydrogenase
MVERIRVGMVGGGQGAFIGAIHRFGLRLTGRYDLLAGALSSNPQRAAASGLELGLEPARSYASYEEMARAESARADGIEVAVIVTPNHLHHPVARAFLEAGIHVVCDKPLALNLAQALELAAIVRRTGRQLFVTYTYAAYAMVRQARTMVRDGVIGAVRVVQVEYAQGWLTRPVERGDSKQARWRTDPALAGAGGALGDIGTHAYHLAGFVSGLAVEQVAADLSSFVPGRRLDDNAQVLLRFSGGARGMLWASQVAAGEDNALRLRVYGDRGSLCWEQEHPEELRHAALGEPARILRRAGPGVAVTGVSQLPAGHPEGCLEGFGQLYDEVADALVAIRHGGSPTSLVAGIDEGIQGMRFVEACVQSAGKDAAWIRLS